MKFLLLMLAIEPGLLGEKRVCYLCAMQPPPSLWPSDFTWTGDLRARPGFHGRPDAVQAPVLCRLQHHPLALLGPGSARHWTPAPVSEAWPDAVRGSWFKLSLVNSDEHLIRLAVLIGNRTHDWQLWQELPCHDSILEAWSNLGVTLSVLASPGL